MKKTLLLLLMLPLYALAQDKYPNLFIKFNQTALTDFFTAPRLQAAVEKSLNKHFGLQAEFGYIVPVDTRGQSDCRVLLEGRYYFKTEGDRAQHRHYVAISPHYRYSYSYASIFYYANSDPHVKVKDNFAVSRNFFGVNAVIGDQLLFKLFTMDYAFGVGAIYKYIQNAPNRVFDPLVDKMDTYSQSFVTRTQLYNSLSENTGWKPNITITVRIGFIFCNHLTKDSPYHQIFATPK